MWTILEVVQPLYIEPQTSKLTKNNLVLSTPNKQLQETNLIHSIGFKHLSEKENEANRIFAKIK